ncbi:TetR family transcriptional regulator [Saccharopolyspora spinosporotrichia]
MSASSQQPRLQLVAGAADMIRRRGLNATSIREVAKHAQAPLGSTYHYFPGGKRQLAGEAVRFAGRPFRSCCARTSTPDRSKVCGRCWTSGARS